MAVNVLIKLNKKKIKIETYRGKTSWQMSSLPHPYIHHVHSSSSTLLPFVRRTLNTDVIGLYDSVHVTIVSGDDNQKESPKVNYDFIIFINLFCFI